MSKKPGYVYILTNPSFKENWVKIGKSSRPVDVRSKELDNTAVPLPFEIYATLKTTKFDEAEKMIHRSIERFTKKRIRDNREFFNVKPEEALDIFYDVAALLDDAEIEVYVKKAGKKSKTKSANKSSNFDFRYERASQKTKEWFSKIREYIMSKPNMEEHKEQKYMGYRKNKRNILCVIINNEQLRLEVRLDVKKVKFENGFSRDMTGKRVWGGINKVELFIKSDEAGEKAKRIIDMAYNEN